MLKRSSWLLRNDHRCNRWPTTTTTTTTTAPGGGGGGRTSTAKRTYRGTAGEGVAATLSDEERALYQIAQPRSVQILARYEQLPDWTTIPKASLMSSLTTTSNNTNDQQQQRHQSFADAVRCKRLIYRAKQRGWLEVDLLLGTWASQNVMSLTESELDAFEAFVNLETIDIYNLITLRVPAQEFLAASAAASASSSFSTTTAGTTLANNNSNNNRNHPRVTAGAMIERIQAWAKSNPLGKADPDEYQKIKDEANLI